MFLVQVWPRHVPVYIPWGAYTVCSLYCHMLRLLLACSCTTAISKPFFVLVRCYRNLLCYRFREAHDTHCKKTAKIINPSQTRVVVVTMAVTAFLHVTVARHQSDAFCE